MNLMLPGPLSLLSPPRSLQGVLVIIWAARLVRECGRLSQSCSFEVGAGGRDWKRVALVLLNNYSAGICCSHIHLKTLIALADLHAILKSFFAVEATSCSAIHSQSRLPNPDTRSSNSLAPKPIILQTANPEPQTPES